MFSANCRPGMAREREGHRRHLDYGEPKSFQDLPLCRFLRLIGDELDAGLAGSSGISVLTLADRNRAAQPTDR
jgi:hypothetical protein